MKSSAYAGPLVDPSPKRRLDCRGKLTAKQRAIVRAERVKRAHGPRSPLWRECIEFREAHYATMSDRDFWTLSDIINTDRQCGVLL